MHNGYTARPVFFPVASIVASGNGFAIRYEDVNIRSQSYIRTHQKRYHEGDSIWRPKRDDPRSMAGIWRTLFHESRQKAIDRDLYHNWHHDGTFKRLIEGDKVYSDRVKAMEGLQKNGKNAQNAFENARRVQGEALQRGDGMLQTSDFATSSRAPNAEQVDPTPQGNGVLSQAAE